MVKRYEDVNVYDLTFTTNEYGEATLQFTDGKIIKGNTWWPEILQELRPLVTSL